MTPRVTTTEFLHPTPLPDSSPSPPAQRADHRTEPSVEPSFFTPHGRAEPPDSRSAAPRAEEILVRLPSERGRRPRARRAVPLYPFLTADGKGPAGALRTHAGPALEGDACVVLTSIQPGSARIVNESANTQAVVFAGQQLELRPWEIRNVSL
jgi:hypothetical protein